MKYKIIIPKEEPKQPKTFKELFVNTNIEPTTDENGNIQYNFKATKKQERLANDTNSNSWGFEVIKTEEDAKIFVETMENIPEPNDKLKKAFRDFKKQETLEEASTNYANKNFSTKDPIADEGWYASWLGFRNGAKWQAQRMYSEFESKTMLIKLRHDILINGDVDLEKWFNLNKK